MAERARIPASLALARLLLGHIGRFRTGQLQDLAAATLREPTARHRLVVPAVNLTLRARRATRTALYVRPRLAASRARFAVRYRGHAVSAAGIRLSLLCPTRQRPRQLAALLRSLDRSAHRGDRVEILCYVDADDPALAGYRRLFDRAGRRFPRLGRCVLHIGAPLGVPTAWNVLAAESTGDYLLMANDDQLYADYGWDVTVDRTVAELAEREPDGVHCLYFDGGQYPDGGYDFPVISRRWYATLGYYAPTAFQQWQAEKWIFDIAERIGRLRPIPGVFVEHLHYQDYKAPFDPTYQRHRMTRATSFADQALFLRTERDRAAAAAKLARAIGTYGTDPGPAAEPDRIGTATEGLGMTTAEPAAAVRPDRDVAAYIMQMVRRHFGNLIDAWNYGGEWDRARECAELAVRLGVWSEPFQRPRELVPGLEARPVHDPAQFWFTGFIEEQYPQIRAEIEQVLDTPHDPVLPTVDDAGLIRHGNWRQGHLFRDGHWQEQVCARFPVTTAVLREVPEVSTFSPGVISVSRVLPGTHIMPHCGPTNAVLRIHLGIKVPAGVWIRVAGQTLSWQEGRCMVFDDSFEHEVRHEGTEDRVVLIFDMLHPELGGDQRQRLLERRLAFEEQIIAFMKERGLKRIGVRDGELVFHPDAPTSEVAELYMAATGIVGAEVHGSSVTWQRREDRG